jgi:cytochrome c biogenesis protein CcmG, thiol:disulfide interchange protein DsbE
MMSRSLVLVMVLVLASPALLALPSLAAKPAESVGPAQALANFSLPTLTGKIEADSLRGRVVLVDFWASWCVPCKQSFPWLREMHNRYRSKGLTIVAVNLDKQREKSTAFLDANPAPFTVAYDPFGKSAEAFQVKAMPTSFLFNRAGELVYTHTGFDPKDAAAFEERIRQECAK